MSLYIDRARHSIKKKKVLSRIDGLSFLTHYIPTLPHFYSINSDLSVALTVSSLENAVRGKSTGQIYIFLSHLWEQGGAYFIDVIRTNSKRLLIILYSNQFYNNTVGSLVFSTTMFDYGKIPSVLQISTMQNLSALF